MYIMGRTMRNAYYLLFLCAILSFIVSGCGHSSGSSAIIGTGVTTTTVTTVTTTSTGVTTTIGSSGTQKWSTVLLDTVIGGTSGVVTPTFISSPAMAPDGTIYVGSTDHFLYALNPDGTVKWKYQTGGNLYASPAIGSDGTIYIGSEDRQFYAINPANGTLKWITPTDTDFTSSAAIGADGTIYVAGTNQDKTIFSCPTLSTCSANNTASITSTPGANSTQPIQCASDSDCPTGEKCVIGTSVTVQLSRLFAINPNNGLIKWVAGQDNEQLLSGNTLPTQLSGTVNSSPAVAGDGTIYVGSEGDVFFDRSDICNPDSHFPASNANPLIPANGHLYAFNPDGTLKWHFETLGRVDSSPAIAADGTVYVGSQRTLKLYGKDQTAASLLDDNPSAEGYIYSISPAGKFNWVDNLLGDVDSSPALGSDGTIYIGADNFHVYSLNPATGSVNWVMPTRDKVKSSPAIASDGTIYIGSNDGSLYGFNPDGTVKLQFIAGDTASSTVNSGPSIGSDGTIYFTSADNKIFALFGGKNSDGSPIGLAASSWPKFRHDLQNTGRHP